MSKTNYLQAVISDLQRTAGPYRCATMDERKYRVQISACHWHDLALVGVRTPIRP
jgi:hypothetical protein